MSVGLVFSLELERAGRMFRYEGHAAGEILGIAGPSGAGKTTLLRLLAGLEQATRGHVELDGETLSDTSEDLWTPPEARRIGLVFQDARLFPHLSVERNIRYAMSRGRRNTRNRLQPNPEALVDLLDIRPLLNRKPAGLSGGERQRVALARALLASPRCLLLDEPFGALDAPMKAGLLPLLEDIRQSMGIPMVLVSHSPEDLGRAAHRILRIEDGTTLAPAGSVQTASISSNIRTAVFPRKAVS